MMMHATLAQLRSLKLDGRVLGTSLFRAVYRQVSTRSLLFATTVVEM